MNVMITGISSGLGRGLAQVHLQRGDQVFGLSRREPSGLAPEEALRFVPADLTAYPALPGQLDTLLEGIHQLDLVYLNAGILGEIRDLKDSPLPDLRQVMEINCWANKVLLDLLFGRGIPITTIIGISSGASVNGSRGWSGYALSKAALNMLIQLYAREQPDTHFISLAPGLVNTAMQDVLCDQIDPAEFPSIHKLRDARDSGAMPSPAEAADLILEALPRLADQSSGSFVDIRTLD